MKTNKITAISLVRSFVLLPIIVVTIFATSCTKHITTTVTEYVKDTVTLKTSDTLVVVKPEVKYIEKTDTVIVESTPECPEPPVIYSDTVWVEGTYCDAYALVWANKVIVGIKEGKEFEIMLKGVIRERDHYREKYREQKTITEKRAWRKDALIVLLSLSLFMLIAQKLLNR